MNRFQLPWKQRPVPRDMVPEVWQAFADYADEKNTEVKKEKWRAFEATRQKHYDQKGDRI